MVLGELGAGSCSGVETQTSRLMELSPKEVALVIFSGSERKG